LSELGRVILDVSEEVCALRLLYCSINTKHKNEALFPTSASLDALQLRRNETPHASSNNFSVGCPFARDM
jgi:hypothetical protein